MVRRNPVTAIVGARQVRKTTLAHQFLSRRAGPAAFFDLGNPEHLSRLLEDLEPLR